MQPNFVKEITSYNGSNEIICVYLIDMLSYLSVLDFQVSLTSSAKYYDYELSCV